MENEEQSGAGENKAAEAPEGGAPPAESKGPEAPERPAAAPAPAKKRPRSLVLILLAVSAVTIAVVVALSVREMRPAGPIPGYAISLGGDSSTRPPEPAPPPSNGADAGIVDDAERLGPGAHLTVDLRPLRRVEGRIELRAFLVRGTAARPWPLLVKPSDGGSIHIEGAREALFPAGIDEGRWVMVFAVGRPKALPEVGAVPELLSKGGDRTAHEGYALLVRSVNLASSD